MTFSFSGEGLYAGNIWYVESRGHKAIFHYIEDKAVTYQIYEKLDNVERKLERCDGGYVGTCDSKPYFIIYT